eukprot:4445538-Lingulodinium_polyedra.AAC.1
MGHIWQLLLASVAGDRAWRSARARYSFFGRRSPWGPCRATDGRGWDPAAGRPSTRQLGRG